MPKLSYPILSLPTAEEAGAFRALERVFRDDETLAATIRQWVTWDGDVSDLTEPTFSTCPFLRLSPHGDASEWATEQQHGGAVVIRVTLCAAGTDANQIMNLWAAVRRALFPSDLTQRALVLSPLQLAGVNRPILSQPAYGVTADEKGAPLLVADGLIKLSMLIMT